MEGHVTEYVDLKNQVEARCRDRQQTDDMADMADMADTADRNCGSKEGS